MFFGALLSASLLIVSQPAPSADETTDGDWAALPTSIEIAENTLGVLTTDADQRGVFLACTKDRFFARVATEPMQMAEMALKQTGRSRTVTGTLYRNGEVVDESKWGYLPSLKVAVPTTARPAAILFNAAVRGDTIELELPRIGRFSVDVPAADDAFAAFASGCADLRDGE